MAANEITKQIIEYCIKSGHYVTRINNIPRRKFMKSNTINGVSDIMGCTGRKIGKYPSGTALAIEVKTTDKQSEDQKKFEENFKKRGGIYILAHSLDDVIGFGL